MSDPPGSAAPKLAVLTVAVVRDDIDRSMLELQISRLQRHTTAPMTIHVAAVRVPSDVREWLAGQPDVTVVMPERVDDVGNREHAAYLDALLAAARATDATHFATFDLDSFPIADDWLTTVLARLPPGAGVAGVLRRENGDVCLPHPSGIVLTRAFVDAHAVSFSPDSDGTPGFRRFLRETRQRGDTGIRLAYTLWSDHLLWERMVRTNVVDLHPIIAGIYADCIFHLGAGSRAALFRADVAASRAHRLTRPIERIPVGHGRARAAKQRVLRALRRRAEARIIDENRRIAREAQAWLLRDPDGLFRHLRGEDPESSPDRVG
jgi:hypothetical protein